METLLIERLSTLSHPHRMGVFRLLMRRYPDELPAGEICDALALKPSTTSVYLSALHQVGLISQRRDATRLLYAVNLDAMRMVIGALLADCCQGRPDLCPPEFAGFLDNGAPRRGQKRNVLFVCTGNSARSIIAETILRDMAGDRFNAYSAGTLPRSALNPTALHVLKTKGHDISPLHAKHINAFQTSDAPLMDFVFTVCDRAANEDCPTWAGQPISGHWGMPDPARVDGTEAQKQLAFHQTYGAFHNRISIFCALPLDELDRPSQQRHVDDIAKQSATKE